MNNHSYPFLASSLQEEEDCPISSDCQNQSVMPFAPSYQTPIFSIYGYDSMEDCDKDVAYMKELCPKAVRYIQKEVEEECDKLEFRGSCMFDECPDKTRLGVIVTTIFNRVKDSEFDRPAMTAESLNNRRPCHGGFCPPPPPPPPRPPFPCRDGFCPPPHPPRPPHSPRPPFPCRDGFCPPPHPCQHEFCPPRADYRTDGEPDWLKNTIEVLLYNEMNQRRRRYRSRNQW